MLVATRWSHHAGRRHCRAEHCKQATKRARSGGDRLAAGSGSQRAEKIARDEALITLRLARRPGAGCSTTSWGQRCLTRWTIWIS